MNEMKDNRIHFNRAAFRELIGACNKAELARQIGIQRQVIYFYLAGGMPSVENLYRIATHFQVPPETLIIRTDNLEAAA